MTPFEAMAALDAIVAEEPRENQYTVAKALYTASLAGIVVVPLSPHLLYRWVFKWATLPEARGRGERHVSRLT